MSKKYRKIIIKINCRHSRAITKLTEDTTTTDNAPKPYYHVGFNHMFALWRYWMTHEEDCFAELLTNNQGTAHFYKELPKKVDTLLETGDILAAVASEKVLGTRHVKAMN